MGNTGMYVQRAALALLIACHGSTPSTSHGSGTGSGTAETAGVVAPSAPQQNEAQTAGNHPPEPTSDGPSGSHPTVPSAPTATGSTTTGSTAGARPTGKSGSPGAAGGETTGSPGGKRGGSAGSGQGPAGAASGPGIEEPCGPDDTCAPGLTCIAYYGFAGPRGPQFKTCEIRCKDDSACPKGRSCATVSDGPGRVCR
jgi:hypothetical protein